MRRWLTLVMLTALAGFGVASAAHLRLAGGTIQASGMSVEVTVPAPPESRLVLRPPVLVSESGEPVLAFLAPWDEGPPEGILLCIGSSPCSDGVGPLDWSLADRSLRIAFPRMEVLSYLEHHQAEGDLTLSVTVTVGGGTVVEAGRLTLSAATGD